VSFDVYLLGMAKRERLVTVFESLIDGPEDGPAGPAGDGTFVVRAKTRKEIEKKVAGKTCYGREVKITETQVSLRLARRWGFA